MESHSTAPLAPERAISLLALLFASAWLFIFGAGMIALLYWPVAVQKLTGDIDYRPQLPLAEARTESFEEIAEELPPRVPYPALSETNDISEGNWIRIPSIGVAVPVALSPTMNDADVLKTLDLGAALYPNGVAPGHMGNTFISAHSTGEPWKGKYRFAFLKINELEDGNLIHLDSNGVRYTYRITSKEIVTPTPDFRVVSDRLMPTVTLMACWPLWTTDERMLLHGELTNITKLTPTPA